MSVHCFIYSWAANSRLGCKTQSADESTFREELEHLSLNVGETKELIVDFRRRHGHHFPLYTNGATVEIVKSSKDLTWTP